MPRPSVHPLDIETDFNVLSLRDLIAARDLYHLHLMAKQHVVGTAIGRYLIRDEEPWPGTQGELTASDTRYAQLKRKPPRTLANSSVRPYSWPSVLVFVDAWEDDARLLPGTAVPRSLYMPNGTRVPVCVVYVEPDERVPVARPPRLYPGHRLGGGYPLLLEVQGEQRIASVGCLVSDGHHVYALTNRHVTGPEGTAVEALLCGKRTRVGTSSSKQLSRKPFADIFPGFAGDRVYLNLDIGLVQIEDLDRWTAQIYGLGQMGRLADVSVDNISLRLLEQSVRAYGAVSGPLEGVIKGLFYRYKSVGGFEYVSDFLIGPRKNQGVLRTRPGDSGTVWFLPTEQRGLQPLAVQWGAQAFKGDDGVTCSPFVLASALSSACSLLEIDIVRDWNLGTLEYWGAVGHYSIATRAVDALKTPRLQQLFGANVDRISFTRSTLSPAATKGLSKKPFVPLADVPDMVWKMRGPGGRGNAENPAHFADMDAPDPGNGNRTLLELCMQKPERVNPQFWLDYYERVKDRSKGSLPFRAWQFFEAMVKFARGGRETDFVCAAGVLSHYVGDACQPLHISSFFNGDPDTNVGKGVHSSFEADMINRHMVEIISGLDALKFKKMTRFARTGQEVAVGVVKLMNTCFQHLPPQTLLTAFVKATNDGLSKSQVADALWDKFGSDTIFVMQAGAGTLAWIWESAWRAGKGKKGKAKRPNVIDQKALTSRYLKKTFIPSMTLAKMDAILQQ